MMRVRLYAVAGVLLLALCPERALAALVEYGPLSGANVEYPTVTENADPLLLGAPSVFGDSLVFDPIAFSAGSSGFGFGLADATLSVTVEPQLGEALQSIGIAVSGSYELTGSGGAGTLAQVNGLFLFDVFVLLGDGSTVLIKPNPSVSFGPSGGTFDLASDPPTGTWFGEVSLDVPQAVSAAGLAGVAERLSVTLDLGLNTQSESGTSASIQVDPDGGFVFQAVPVPGPPAAPLLALALLVGALHAAGRR